VPSRNAWFEDTGTEQPAMATLLLERPATEILATSMPPGKPVGPGGDEAETGNEADREEEDDESEPT
jgi:hypothetical protein